MLTYIALASFTDQGLRSVKDTTKRAQGARETAGRFGVKMKDIYWTQGQYDLVTVCEADSETAITAFGLALTSAGNVRFQTMRARFNSAAYSSPYTPLAMRILKRLARRATRPSQAAPLPDGFFNRAKAPATADFS